MTQQPTLVWNIVTDYASTGDIHNCLYVLYSPHSKFENRPFYIGKAKRLGGNSRSRYNPGYGHLIDGLLQSGFSLYYAQLNPSEFNNAEHYEEYLISLWNPVRNKRRGRFTAYSLITELPWLTQHN